MQNRLLFASLLAATLSVASCELVSDVADPNDHPADGRYKGDFQVVVAYTDNTNPNNPVGKTRSLTGAVEFTVQDDKVITTPVAGDGQVWWDQPNQTVWVEFRSIVSSNESMCSQWRYYGGITGDTNFLQGEGTITCIGPSADYRGMEFTYWKVNRQ